MVKEVLKLRTTFSGQIMGTGKYVLYFQCNDCKKLINPRVDPGRWGAKTVLCRKCSGSLTGIMPRDENKSMPILSVAPALYQNASLDDFESKIRQAVTCWPKRFTFLGIIGQPGTGKTHLAWSIEKHLASRGIKVKVLDAQQAKLDWFESQYRESLIKAWKKERYLIVDDLTRVSPSEGWSAVLTDVIDSRTSNDKATIVCTMDAGDVIQKSYGKALRSRLAYFDWLHLKGKDRRRPAKKTSEDKQ